MSGFSRESAIHAFAESGSIELDPNVQAGRCLPEDNVRCQDSLAVTAAADMRAQGSRLLVNDSRSIYSCRLRKASKDFQARMGESDDWSSDGCSEWVLLVTVSLLAKPCIHSKSCIDYLLLMAR